MRKTDFVELNPLINILENEISLVHDQEEYTKALEELKGDKSKLTKESNDLNNYLQVQKMSTEKLLLSSEGNIKEKTEKINNIQQHIDDITPSFNTLKNRLKEKSSDRENILKVLEERRTLVNQSREVHKQHQERRRSIKAELRTKLGTVLSKRQQLIDDEVPLIKALEDVEAQVRDAQNAASQQLILLGEEREKVLALLEEENEKYQIIHAKELKVSKEKEDIQHEIGLNRIKHERLRKEIIQIQSATKNMENEILNRGIKDSEDSKMLETVEKQIEQRLFQIESLRKEINRLSSICRVTMRENAILEDNNHQLEDTLSSFTSHESRLIEEKNKLNDRKKVMKETIAAFRRLKNTLSIPEHSSSINIASKAIDIVRTGQSRTVGVLPAPQRVTPRMIEEDLDKISQKIAKINAKIAA